jgi:hypothetical protein
MICVTGFCCIFFPSVVSAIVWLANPVVPFAAVFFFFPPPPSAGFFEYLVIGLVASSVKWPSIIW